jgi:hypothetical protein
LLGSLSSFGEMNRDLRWSHRFGKTFADFGLKSKSSAFTGPVVTQYEIALETGLRVSPRDLVVRRSSAQLASGERPHRRAIAAETPLVLNFPTRTRGRPFEELIVAARDRVGNRSCRCFGKDSEPAARTRSGGHAAPAHRRPNGHRQIGLLKLDHPKPAIDANARRMPVVDD